MNLIEFKNAIEKAVEERNKRLIEVEKLLSTKKICLFGFGNKGRFLANQLSAIDAKIIVFDSDANKRNDAKKQGYEVIDSLPSFESYCFILGSGQNQTEQQEVVGKNYIFYHECAYFYNLANYFESSRNFSDFIPNRSSELFELYQKINPAFQETYFNILLFKASLNPNYVKDYRKGLPAMWIDVPHLTYHRAYENYCDVGAYDGDTILAFSQKFPLQKAYAVEVNKIFNEKIVHNSSMVKNGVEIIPYAAWSEKTTLDFKEDHNGMFAIFPSEHGGIKAEALDSLIRGKIDVIKLDIEGAEIEAFRGATQLLTENEPDILIASYHRSSDFIDIPQYIDNLIGLSKYEICVNHYSECMDDSIFYFMKKK
jgi:FkbM family methyltransferase